MMKSCNFSLTEKMTFSCNLTELIHHVLPNILIILLILQLHDLGRIAMVH